MKTLFGALMALALVGCDLYQTGSSQCVRAGAPPAADALAGLAAGTSVVISPERRDELPAAVIVLPNIPERGLYLGDAGAALTPPYLILGPIETEAPPAGQVHRLTASYYMGAARVFGGANVRVTRSDAEAFEGTFSACVKNCNNTFGTFRCGVGFPVSGAFRGVRKDIDP